MKITEKGYRVETKIDYETGTQQLTYYLYDKIIPHVPISGKIARRLTGLAMINKDLAHAFEWLEDAEKLIAAVVFEGDPKYAKLTDREVGNRIKSLFVSSIIFYAKAFTKADGRNAKLEKSMLDPNFHAAHDEMMKLRNNFVAHSGDQRKEYGDSNILLWPVDDDNFSLYVQTNRTQLDFAFPPGDCNRFTLLVEHVMAKAEDHYSKLASRTIDWAIKKGPRFWMTAYGSRKQLK